MTRLATRGLVACLFCFLACGNDDAVQVQGDSDGGNGNGTGSDAGYVPGAPIDNVHVGTAPAAGGVPTSGLPGAGACKAGNAACNDCIDNDGDGKTDAEDSECIGPLDNDEASFATGIPGDNIDACKQDCFFDGNSGQGDDGCDWNLKCDPANPGAHAAKACPYEKNFKNCPTTQSQKCIDNCRKLAPNGCDCFGCCAVDVNGTSATVLLTGTCSAANFGDPNKCPRCTQQTSCVNTCEKCEVCVNGQKPDPSCATGGSTADGGVATPGADAAVPPTSSQCDPGIISCGAGGQVAANACPAFTYCLSGCCIVYGVN